MDRNQYRKSPPNLTDGARDLYFAACDFIYALEHGFLACKDDSAFIDGLRAAIAKAEGRAP